MLVTGAGQISMAIARRIGFGKKIILGDKKIENATAIAKVMNEAGYACHSTGPSSSFQAVIICSAYLLIDSAPKA